MGNRAHIIFPETENASHAVAVYLHWNGGVESVQTFLDYLSSEGVRANQYGAARFIQLVGNYFGGTLSLGVTYADMSNLSPLDHGDNGIYIIDSANDKFEIKEHFWLDDDGKRVPFKDDDIDRGKMTAILGDLSKTSDAFFHKNELR